MWFLASSATNVVDSVFKYYDDSTEEGLEVFYQYSVLKLKIRELANIYTHDLFDLILNKWYFLSVDISGSQRRIKRIINLHALSDVQASFAFMSSNFYLTLQRSKTVLVMSIGSIFNMRELYI